MFLLFWCREYKTNANTNKSGDNAKPELKFLSEIYKWNILSGVYLFWHCFFWLFLKTEEWMNWYFTGVYIKFFQNIYDTEVWLMEVLDTWFSVQTITVFTISCHFFKFKVKCILKRNAEDINSSRLHNLQNTNKTALPEHADDVYLNNFIWRHLHSA